MTNRCTCFIDLTESLRNPIIRRCSFCSQNERDAEDRQKFLNLFSDYEFSCNDFDTAAKVWADMHMKANKDAKELDHLRVENDDYRKANLALSEELAWLRAPSPCQVEGHTMATWISPQKEFPGDVVGAPYCIICDAR